jgi:fumarylacetoacetate (FAA) hydrolase
LRFNAFSLIQGDKSGENAAMKLATYQDGSRDGQLVVVSRDLSLAAYASNIASRLQQVLDDWNYLSPQLQDVYDALNAGRTRHAFPFDPAQCMAPLPRAYQWADGDAYQNPNAQPHMRQGSSDDLRGPCAPIVCGSEALGIDFAAQVAIVTSDLPAGCAPDRALDGIRLLMLVNDVRLCHPSSAELAKAFSPVAITPDELGDAWAKGRVHLTLQTTWNGRKVGMCDAGADMTFHFGQLMAQLCKTRTVRAGTLIGSGPVSNQGVVKKSRTDWPKGYNSITEKRAMETQQDGQPSTEFMKFGDTIRMEMKGRDGQSLFGAIEQEVVP